MNFRMAGYGGPVKRRPFWSAAIHRRFDLPFPFRAEKAKTKRKTKAAMNRRTPKGGVDA